MPNRDLVAVTTAAAVAMLMMVLMVVTASASTVVIVIVVTSAVASTTTVAAIAAATSSEVLHHVVYLFLSGVAVLQNGTFEVECLTSQRMVEVNLHLLFANLQYATIEAVTLLILQGHDGVNIDMLVVEVAIDAEYLACQIQHVFVVIFTIALFLAQRDIEVLAFRSSNHLLLELVECKAEACDEAEGALCSSLFDEFFTIVTVNIQLV